MKAKILSVKNINVLRTIIMINAVLFVAAVLISVFVLNEPKLWFYFFCIAVGGYLIAKAYLYSSDSNCYLGCLLFLLGSFLILNHFLLFLYQFFVIVGAFVFASLITFIFFKQVFHFFLGLCLGILMVIYYFYRQNFINIYIFLALILINVFIFYFIYAKIKIRK